MTTLRDLEKIVPGIIKELQDISDKMSRYSKIDTDLRARELMSEIKDKIEQIKDNMKVFKNGSLYVNFNFDEYVVELRNYVTESELIYQRIKRFEKATDYYGDKPFKNINKEKSLTSSNDYRTLPHSDLNNSESNSNPPQPGE